MKGKVRTEFSFVIENREEEAPRVEKTRSNLSSTKLNAILYAASGE